MPHEVDDEETQGPVEVLLSDGVWHKVIPGTWTVLPEDLGYAFVEALPGQTAETRYRLQVPHIAVQAFRSRV